jgi:hypothetical protein
MPGNITTYEEHDARVQAGYTLNAWYHLPWQARALEIAHYRLRWYIKAHVEEEAMINSKRQRRGARR